MMKRKIMLTAVLSASMMTQVTKPVSLTEALDKVKAAITGVSQVLTDVSAVVTSITGTTSDMKSLLEQFNAAKKVSDKINILTKMNTSILASLDSLMKLTSSVEGNLVRVFNAKAADKMLEVVNAVNQIKSTIATVNTSVSELITTITALEAMGALGA